MSSQPSRWLRQCEYVLLRCGQRKEKHARVCLDCAGRSNTTGRAHVPQPPEEVPHPSSTRVVASLAATGTGGEPDRPPPGTVSCSVSICSVVGSLVSERNAGGAGGGGTIATVETQPKAEEREKTTAARPPAATSRAAGCPPVAPHGTRRPAVTCFPARTTTAGQSPAAPPTFAGRAPRAPRRPAVARQSTLLLVH